MTARDLPTRAAFTLVEAAMSIIVVSVMLVGSLRVLGTARAGELTAQRRSISIALAQDLMSEILAQAYKEAGAVDALSPSVAELTGTRAPFNDVDDYNGWTANPPEAKDGTVLTDFDAYERSVEVAWVDPDDLTLVSNTSTGVKRVIVTVTLAQRQHARLVAFRTDSFDPRPAAP